MKNRYSFSCYLLFTVRMKVEEVFTDQRNVQSKLSRPSEEGSGAANRQENLRSVHKCREFPHRVGMLGGQLDGEA